MPMPMPTYTHPYTLVVLRTHQVYRLERTRRLPALLTRLRRLWSWRP